MSEAVDPTAVAKVIADAKRRIFHGAGYGGRCVCEVREEANVRPNHRYPEAEGSRWCFLCSVEAAQKALGLHGDYFGYALDELALDICGRRFGLMHWCDRDDVLFGAFDGVDWDQARILFERTSRRLNSGAAA